ncbi:MAG: 16S rRNA (adenine(1518)-N(6)/adenine(1519)-N(6))-dimethyltransferase RsmA [Thermoplasmata archaeon]
MTTSTGSSSPRSPERAATATREGISAELERLGVRPKRSWGQSFLTDPFVADAEAALVEVAPGTPVVEVGGGLGMLTEALLRRRITPLTVIERDRQLAAHLRGRFRGEAKVREADALTAEWGRPGALVGNLPFSVATLILVRAFDLRIPRVIALVQREVAERLAAGPGSRVYGRLSILAALHGSVELFQVVAPTTFEPEPEVEGRILRFLRRSGELPVPSEGGFEEMLRRLFSGRRKQLANLLPRVTPRGTSPEELARAAGWPKDWEHRRPETLRPEDFFALARSLHALST